MKKIMVKLLLKLIDSGLIKSAHDVSIGGIITAVSQRCVLKEIKVLTLKNQNI